MRKMLRAILLHVTPIIALISLIPLVENEYALTAIYAISILILLWTRPQKHDLTALVFGVVGITIAEYLFISTGVETFERRTLLSVMPLWLPLLWGFAFVTIKRCLRLIDRH